MLKNIFVVMYFVLNSVFVAPAQAKSVTLTQVWKHHLACFIPSFLFTTFSTPFIKWDRKRECFQSIRDIFFHVEWSFINQRNPNVCFLDFSFPCVGLVV